MILPEFLLNLYRSVDKIIIKIFISTTAVGFYINAEKIISVPIALVTALGNVILPKIKNLLIHEEHESIDKLQSLSMTVSIFISIDFVFGLNLISKEIVMILFGSEFLPMIDLLNIMTLLIPITSISKNIDQQFLIPYNKDSYYVKAVIGGSLLNIALCFILIELFVNQRCNICYIHRGRCNHDI